MGPENFIKNARETFALQECASFFGVQLVRTSDLQSLIEKAAERHSDIFYYGFYFAPWAKSDVPKHQRCFQDFDA